MTDRMISGLNRQKAIHMVEELFRLGLRHVILCPGARNTPLLMAFSEHTAFDPQLVLDERGAAFMALGLLRAEAAHGAITGPACVVTTSGTAALNMMPAIAEAASEGLPLLIITADRGPSEQLLGANQSLPQREALRAACRGSYEIPAAEESRLLLLRTDQAYGATLSPSAGPVHLNIPFDGNLLPEGDEEVQIKSDRSSEAEPFLLEMPVEAVLSSFQKSHLRDILQKSQRPLMYVAGLSSELDRRAAFELMEQVGCPSFADAGSSLRLGPKPKNLLLHHEFIKLENYAPDLVLQLGKRPVSKRVPAQLSALQVPRIVVDPHPETQDPMMDGGVRYRVTVEKFAEALSGFEFSMADHWLSILQECDQKIDEAMNSTLSNCRHPELKSLSTVLNFLPDQWGLFTGNSLAVRHLDVLAHQRLTRTVQATQRGCSGIDGLLATALGFAKEHHAQCSTPSLALIGDLSLLHDLSSFHIWSENPIPLLVFCINNHGGGIFHQLPQRNHKDLLTPWCDAAHGKSLVGLARSMDLPAWEAHDPGSLQRACEVAFQEGRGLVELSVPAGAHAEGWLSLVETLRSICD